MAVEKAEGPVATPHKPQIMSRTTFVFLIIIGAGVGWFSAGRDGFSPAIVLGGLLATMVVVVIGVPIHYKKTFWISPTSEIRAIELDAPGLPTSLADGHRAAAGALGPLGFVGRGLYSVEGLVANVNNFVGLFEDCGGLTTAEVVHLTLSRKPIGAVLEFTTRFADGSEVVTGNSRLYFLMLQPEFRELFAFPGVEDPGRLCKLHRRALAERGEFSPRVLPIEGNPIAFLARSYAEEPVRLAKLYGLRFDEGSGRYRPTWRGSFLWAWRMFRPWGSIVRAIRQARSARRLRAWEAMDA